MGHGEIRVEADGSLQERHSGDPVASKHGLPSQAVSLQGFKRRRSGLLKRRVEFLDRAERLTELGAQIRRRITQCFQDSLLAVCGFLLLSQGIARAAVHGPEAQNILASQACNRAVKERSALGPLAKVAG